PERSMHATPVRRPLQRPIDHLALRAAGGRAAPGLPSADLRSIYDLAAIIAGQPRRDPQPERLKLPGPVQLTGPALQRSVCRWHDDLFRSCLHTSWDRPIPGPFQQCGDGCRECPFALKSAKLAIGVPLLVGTATLGLD